MTPFPSITQEGQYSNPGFVMNTSVLGTRETLFQWRLQLLLFFSNLLIHGVLKTKDFVHTLWWYAKVSPTWWLFTSWKRKVLGKVDLSQTSLCHARGWHLSCCQTSAVTGLPFHCWVTPLLKWLKRQPHSLPFTLISWHKVPVSLLCLLTVPLLWDPSPSSCTRDIFGLLTSCHWLGKRQLWLFPPFLKNSGLLHMST